MDSPNQTPFKPSREYAAAPDEPFFQLLGRDDVAPHFARAYGYYLQGHVPLAQQELAQIGVKMALTEPLSPHHPKVRSCFETASAMESFAVRKAVGS